MTPLTHNAAPLLSHVTPLIYLTAPLTPTTAPLADNVTPLEQSVTPLKQSVTPLKQNVTPRGGPACFCIDCDPCPRSKEKQAGPPSRMGPDERPTLEQRRPCRMGTLARPLLVLPVTFLPFGRTKPKTGRAGVPILRVSGCRAAAWGSVWCCVLRGGSWNNNAKNTHTANRG